MENKVLERLLNEMSEKYCLDFETVQEQYEERKRITPPSMLAPSFETYMDAFMDEKINDGVMEYRYSRGE